MQVEFQIPAVWLPWLMPRMHICLKPAALGFFCIQLVQVFVYIVTPCSIGLAGPEWDSVKGVKNSVANQCRIHELPLYVLVSIVIGSHDLHSLSICLLSHRLTSVTQPDHLFSTEHCLSFISLQQNWQPTLVPLFQAIINKFNSALTKIVCQ